jgi:putative FmdB family regulatory protein
MPTYDYQCQKCGFEFEREQRITEDPIKTCPKCKARKAKRLLSAPNFILKGGGWYADGYGSSGASSASSGSKEGGGDSGSASSDASSSSSSSDAKSSKSDSGSKSDKPSKPTGKSAA